MWAKGSASVVKTDFVIADLPNQTIVILTTQRGPAIPEKAQVRLF